MPAFVTSRRSWLIAALAIALVLALIFGGRGAVRLYFRMTRPPPPPRQTDVANIAGWMPLRLISRTYRVPQPELAQALGITPEEGFRSASLDEIAAQTGRSSDEVVEIVRETVREWQSTHPEPTGPGPPRRNDPKPNEPDPTRPTGLAPAPSSRSLPASTDRIMLAGRSAS